MGLFKSRKIRAAPTRKDPVAIWLNGGDASDILCPNGYTPLSKNEEIRRCIHKIADMVSNMTIMLMENGEDGDRRIKNELSKKIDIHPNRNMTRKSFIHKLVTDMCLTGNAIAIPHFKGDTWLDDIDIMDIDCASFYRSSTGYTLTYKGEQFEPDEILHFVLNPDDDNPFIGQGYTNMVKHTVQTLLQANATKIGFLQTKWKPSLIITIESDAEELQDLTTRSEILDSYVKTTEAGEPWIIPAGEMKVEKIQPLSLADLAIQDSITLDIKTIACAFGVPPFMLGIGTFDKGEYNNFVSTTIFSIASALQQELTRKLLVSPKMYFKFNAKSLLQYELQEKSAFVTEMVASGMLSRNEGRNEFDYSPADSPGMNDYNVLENYIPVADVGKQKKLKTGKEADISE